MTLDNFLTFENIVSILIITLLMVNMCISIVIDDKLYGTLSLLYLLSVPLLLAYPLTYALVILFIQMIIITRKKYEKNHKTIYRKIDKYTRLQKYNQK